LVDVLETFDGCPENICWCPGDIRWVSWRYLLGFLDIFDVYPGYISWVSLNYFIGFLEIFYSFPGDIS